jgi:hypothetical protein
VQGVLELVPSVHLLLNQLSVLFYRRSAPLPALYLDLLKCTPHRIPWIFIFDNERNFL